MVRVSFVANFILFVFVNSWRSVWEAGFFEFNNFSVQWNYHFFPSSHWAMNFNVSGGRECELLLNIDTKHVKWNHQIFLKKFFRLCEMTSRKQSKSFSPSFDPNHKAFRQTTQSGNKNWKFMKKTSAWDDDEEVGWRSSGWLNNHQKKNIFDRWVVKALYCTCFDR